MGIISLKQDTMKFAIVAVVVAVFSSQALAQNAFFENVKIADLQKVDPDLLAEGAGLYHRLNELGKAIPDKTKAEVSELWDTAKPLGISLVNRILSNPKLPELVSRTGDWAKKTLPIWLAKANGYAKSRGKRSAQFFYQQQQQNYIDPQIISESEGLLLNTVARTNELIDSLPKMSETGREMAQLWDIAYPQLQSLLAKAGSWANQVPTP